VAAVWPEVTRLDAQQRSGVLRSAHALVVVVTSVVCIAFAAALWWEGAGVVAVWTRGRISADVATLRLLLVFLVLQSPWLVGFGFLAAANRHARASTACFISSAIGVVAAALLVPRFGTAGVVAGLIAGDLLACCHFVLRESCQLVGEPYGPFARRLWACLVVVSLGAVLAGWVAHVTIGGPSVVHWREELTARLRPFATSMVSARAG
jgi:O-antigen/teichoic acid export membrane protein